MGFFYIIVHLIIQKLKNKHAFLKTEKAKSSHFDRMRGDKNQIFPTFMPRHEPRTLSQTFLNVSRVQLCLEMKSEQLMEQCVQ